MRSDFHENDLFNSRFPLQVMPAKSDDSTHNNNPTPQPKTQLSNTSAPNERLSNVNVVKKPA